jgi:hypothetical protein
MSTMIEKIQPLAFEPENHFYPKVLNSHLHPLVSYFFDMSRANIIERYTHLNPTVSSDFLEKILHHPIKHFFWGGADLFYVTTEAGERRLIVLETNSCPSGQKSMPLRNNSDEFRGYKLLLEESFIPLMKRKRLPQGALAVIYDKNYTEASGYAATLAELCNEEVYLIPQFDNEDEDRFKLKDKTLCLKHEGKLIPIRAALRYVTQKPWTRLPIQTNTFIYNSTLVCLAGGRNKLLASKAYELFNAETSEEGLEINTPETIRDVNKVEVPLWVHRFGGYAVIKNPYSNAGQGVYTITSQNELDDFMTTEHDYDQFIVQSLIGHYDWSSQNEKGRLYHIGTMPSKKGSIYVADLRMMVYTSPNGFSPCAIYARRAKTPLSATLTEGNSSWDMLGTNLSIKTGENSWESDTNRLMQMDIKDFNTVGIGLDDLIEAFIQTVLSIIAIDNMADTLLNKKGLFRKKLFSSLNNDPRLLSEIMI